MIRSGVDPLLRVDCSESILAYKQNFNVVLLYLSAIDRLNNVIDWIASWWPENKMMVHLKPEGVVWFPFRRQFMIMEFLYVIDDVAVEALAQTQQVFPYNFHVVVVPRLWTILWRNHLRKIIDCIFTLTLILLCWESYNFKPLVLNIYFILFYFILFY